MRGVVIKISIYKNQTKIYKHFYITNTNICTVMTEITKLIEDFASAKHDILYRVKVKGKWSGWRSLHKAIKTKKTNMYPWQMAGVFASVEWKQGKSYVHKLSAMEKHIRGL